jgi:uncharacterized membrane-anchored protein YhcB (DUF1043 family)
MVYPAWPPGKENEGAIRDPDKALPGTRPPEIGDEELRVEDLIAWLETMDPLKPIRIVMKTRNSTVASDIHTIAESFGADATVDIFPLKMPKDYKDLRQMLAEKARDLRDDDLNETELVAARIDEDLDEAQTILNAIKKRKQAAKDRDKQARAEEQIALETPGRKRERLRGAE